MSSTMHFISFAVIALAVILLNILPRQGEQLYCPNDVTSKPHLTVFGRPFDVFATKGSHQECLTSGENHLGGIEPKKSYFYAASLWFDLIISGAVMLAAYFLLDVRKVAK